MKNILIFSITYVFIAVGGLPGFVVDRTGIAFLGAIAMVATGALLPADALSSVHFPTILLLLGLMIISAQFRLGGFYSFLVDRIAAAQASPEKFLLVLMLTSAGLSALLANDIVCLAFTPVIATALIRKKKNPVPYLLRYSGMGHRSRMAYQGFNPAQRFRKRYQFQCVCEFSVIIFFIYNK